MRFVAFILLLASITARAIDAPVNLLRACIDNDNLTVTISWNVASDNCGSFAQYDIYGSENNGPFTLLGTVNSLLTTDYVHSLSSINTNWRYYVITYTSCDGLNNYVSDTIDIDDIYPADIPLDSVSYDIITQNIIAGWSINPSQDTRGYQIYNYSTGDGDSIGFTDLTRFTVTTNPNNRFPVVIATLDSCNLSSLLSTPHTPAFLQSTIDTCANRINLSWQTYSGWNTVDSQVLFLSLNHTNHTPIQTFGSGTNTFVFNNFVLGDTLDFFVRTYSNNKSSSSNRTTVSTRALAVLDHTYLNYVTVEDQSNLLSWQLSSTKDISEVEIEKSDDNISFNRIASLANNVNSYTDNSASPSLQVEYYRIIPINKCGVRWDSSNISSNILLNIKPSLTHNPYQGWDVGVNNYQLQFSTDGSTWNTIEQNNSEIQTTIDPTETGCYRILATEEGNFLGESNLSYSNLRCKQDSLFIEVTTGINPESLNNSFLVYGRGVDHNASTYSIYTRWGELLAQNPTDQTWDLMYNGKPIQPGVYLYVVNATGVLGDKQTVKGTFHVIR